MKKRKGKIGSSWTKRVRKVNGKRKTVKVRKRGGKYQVRVLKKRNLVDRTARKKGRKRKKGIYSSTDRGPRRHKRKR